MENKIIFLLIAILLIWVLFSKQGTEFIKKIIGIATTSTTPSVGASTDTGKTYSGGVDDKTISGGMNVA